MTRAPRVVVRRARTGDLDAVVAMRLALLAASADNPIQRHLRPDYGDRARPLFEQQLADTRCLTLVAWLGDTRVGLLRCLLSASNPLRSPARHAYVMSAFVVPDCRRRGVLRALLRSAEAWSARHGVSEIRLHCGVENDAANAAWRALGFQPAELLYVRSPAARGRKRR